MPRTSMWLSCLLLFSLLTAFHVQAIADQASDEAAKLAGKRAKEWVFQKWEILMGPGNKCKAGKSYRFKADHSVVISSCIDGEVHTETQQWGIESTDALETHVKVGNTSYILKFWDTAQGHFMMLRIMGQSKVDPTRDMIFQLAED